MMDVVIPQTGRHASLSRLHSRRMRLRVGLANAYLPESRERVALELADVDLRLVSRYRGLVEHHARQRNRSEMRRAMEAMAFHALEAQGILAAW